MTLSTRKLTVAAVGAVLVGGVYASPAGAMSALVPVPDPPSRDEEFTGILDDSERRKTRAKQDGIELRTRERTTVRTFELTYPERSVSGWHSHAGIVVALVRSGSVVRQTGCTTETFRAGEAFTEVGPHHVSNPGSVPAVLSITHIFPTGLPLTTPEEAPDCDR